MILKTLSFTKTKKGKQQAGEIEFLTELVLKNCMDIRAELLEISTMADVFTVKTKQDSNIDLAGLQLLVSFVQTIKKKKKEADVHLHLQVTKELAEVIHNNGFGEIFGQLKYLEN